MFCSTRRAKYGMALMVNGTMAAAVPTVVPTSRRVSGMMAISRMRNGNERNMLTSPLTTAWSRGGGAMDPGAWTNSQTASGGANKTATGTAAPITAEDSSIACAQSERSAMIRAIRLDLTQ